MRTHSTGIRTFHTLCVCVLSPERFCSESMSTIFTLFRNVSWVKVYCYLFEFASNNFNSVMPALLAEYLSSCLWKDGWLLTCTISLWNWTGVGFIANTAFQNSWVGMLFKFISCISRLIIRTWHRVSGQLKIQNKKNFLFWLVLKHWLKSCVKSRDFIGRLLDIWK